MPGDNMHARLYWGDFHNHCSVGLFHHAKGSLARAIDIARTHLDFFAFTGHSHWHDMPEMPGDAHLKWAEGFAHHTKLWPQTKRTIAAANSPGRFVAFLGYEWHSALYGDRCVIFPGDEGELCPTDNVANLQDYARRVGAILYPHHIGYKTLLPGRGLNWDLFDPELCPVIEIISEYGCAERDRGGWPYISHSNGPRTTGNTYQHALERGLHCGVAGGSDDHLGFPGAYGEGVCGVFAEELSRGAILEAVRRRRTLASTGDRIHIELHVNEGFIGDILPPSPRRHVDVTVKAWDEIDKIELIKNGRIIHRQFPADADGEPVLSGRALLRIEYGWGPWSHFGMPRTADWDVNMKLTGQTRILDRQVCLQTAPFDEHRRHRLDSADDQSFHWLSYTSRTGAYHEIPTNAVVFELDARGDDRLTLSLAAPAKLAFDYSLAELARPSQVEFTGDFPSESFVIHRLVPRQHYRARFSLDDEATGDREDHYYIRVTQANGHMGWCSPIWVRRHVDDPPAGPRPRPTKGAAI